MSKKVCFLVGLVLAVFVFPLQAQPVRDVRIAPGVATHMGQVASEHVVLHSVFTFVIPPDGDVDAVGFEFKRLFPDGSGDLVSDSSFVVPADKVLVVTDVSVTNFIGPAGAASLIQLSIADLVNPPVYSSVFANFGNGAGGTSDGMTSGFIVAPGQEILALRTFSSPVNEPGETTIILRGYLASNQ